MRLWSLHPALLDRQGLTACWREGLLAQAVLAGRTRGYTRHPQLQRFQAQPAPLASIGAYLASVADEAQARGYRFDRARIDRLPSDALPLDPGPAHPVPAGPVPLDPLPADPVPCDPAATVPRIPVTDGQLAYELAHLRAKLAVRSPAVTVPAEPVAHPLFIVEPGAIAPWERPDPIAPTAPRQTERQPRHA